MVLFLALRCSKEKTNPVLCDYFGGQLLVKHLHNSASKQRYRAEVIAAAAPGVNAWRTGCSLMELITMVRGLLQEVKWSWTIAWKVCITSSSTVYGASCFYLNV